MPDIHVDAPKHKQKNISQSENHISGFTGPEKSKCSWQYSTSSLHEAALAYAADGVRIFPLSPGTKHQPTLGGYYNLASNDVSQIAGWWPEGTRRNIGWEPSASGFIVVDLDAVKDEDHEHPKKPRHLEHPVGTKLGRINFDRLRAEHGDTVETRIILTPSGGEQLIYSWPEAISPLGGTVGKIAPKVDTRQLGTYGVLPPSWTCDDPKHKQKEGYYTWGNDKPVAPCPGWLLDLLTRKQKAVVRASGSTLDGNFKVNRALAIDAILRQKAIEPDNGNGQNYPVFAKLLDLGIDGADALDLMERYWWPRDPIELDDKLDHVVKYRQNAIGCDADPMEDDEFVRAFGDVEFVPDIWRKLQHHRFLAHCARILDIEFAGAAEPDDGEPEGRYVVDPWTGELTWVAAYNYDPTLEPEIEDLVLEPIVWSLCHE